MKRISIPYLTLPVIMAAIVSILPSCASDDPDGIQREPMPRKAIKLTEPVMGAAVDLVDFYYRFTLDMTGYVDAKGGGADRNVVVSPLSAAMSFAMAANGADEDMRDGYARYLGLRDMGGINDFCQVLLEKLPEADNTSQFNIVNSVWVNGGRNLTLTDDYSYVVETKYMADIIYRDFVNDNEASLKAMNDWCSSHTAAKLERHFGALDPGTLAVMLIALHFKGLWSDVVFDSSRTVAATFHGGKGDSEAMMMESGCYKGLYASDGDFEFFRLHFGNDAFCIDVIVPEEGKQRTRLDARRISALRKASKDTVLKCFLPRFSVSGNHDLSDMLKSIGKASLLSHDLTMFTTPENGVVAYNQSVCFSIDETGAETSSMTSGQLTDSMTGETNETVVRVDRPFYFFISEFSTSACILSGRISDLDIN